MLNFMVIALKNGYELSAIYYRTFFPLVGALCVFIANQVQVERYQLRFKTYSEYFSSFWNLNDLAYLILNSVLIYLCLVNPGFPIKYTRYIAAISACFLWFKLLDWLRLFD